MRRDPRLAAGLSVIPGLGQFYNGQIPKGAAFLVAALISLPLIYYVVGMVLIPILWIWSGIDAYRTADATQPI